MEAQGGMNSGYRHLPHGQQQQQQQQKPWRQPLHSAFGNYVSPTADYGIPNGNDGDGGCWARCGGGGGGGGVGVANNSSGNNHASALSRQYKATNATHVPPHNFRNTQYRLDDAATGNNDSSSRKIAADQFSNQVDVDKLIAKQLQSMTLQEREDAFHDIHGVKTLTKEEPEVMERLKLELEDELRLIGPTSDAYSKAWNDSPEYVQSLYLMFLRGRNYNVHEAARLMVEHFDMKLKLWGPDKLDRNITQADMDKDDLSFLREGCFHMLGQRDQAGRPIFCKVFYHQKFKHRENVWRCLWYHKMIIAADEESQMKGQCAVIYNVDDRWMDLFDPLLFKGVSEIRAVMPIREASVHYCYSDPRFGGVISFVTSLFDADTKARSKLHRGSHVEIQYELQSYGIPSKILPFNSDGIVQKKDMLSILDRLRVHEEHFGHKMYSNYPGQSCILIPSLYDVLSGRGKPIQTHPGNLRLGFLVEERINDYIDGNRKAKIEISNSIYDSLVENNCRFLKQDNKGIFFEMNRSEAIRKIEHFFRNRKQSLSKVHEDRASSNVCASTKRMTASPIQVSTVSSPVTVSDLSEASEDEQSTSKRYRFSLVSS